MRYADGMHQAATSLDHAHPVWRRPLVLPVLGWMAGLAAGQWFAQPGLWLAAGLPALLGVWLAKRSGCPRLSRGLLLFAMICTAAIWMIAHGHRLPREHIARYVSMPSQLVEVTGTVIESPRLIQADRGAFERFSFRPPATMVVLEVDGLVRDDVLQDCEGYLLLKIEQADVRLQQGDRIHAKGWLSGFDGPRNPGEPDYRQVMTQRGVDGRLTMKQRGNWQLIEPSLWSSGFASLQGQLFNRAHHALHRGLTRSEDEALREQVNIRLAFLDAILLGHRTSELHELHETFRDTGLAHLLSISGAHLGILLGLVWLVMRVLTIIPSRAAMVVFVVLLLYLFAVPVRTPIVRAGIMAGIFCLAYMTGRRLHAIDQLAVAALVVLIVQPAELFTPGFQLSFLAVAGLLLYTQRVTDWFDPLPEQLHERQAYLRSWKRWRRYASGYFAACCVAFFIVTPVVAYHFQIITPLAAPLTFVIFPLVFLVLALGYLKIFVGMVLPGLGEYLAGPLEVCADWMLAMVQWVSQLPAASWNFARPPSEAWVWMTVLLVVAIFSGWFARRKMALTASLCLCLTWLAVSIAPQHLQHIAGPHNSQPIVRLNMFSVGDGSCYLTRLGHGANRHTIMFDCGSQAYFDIGTASIVPALQHMGVSHIDSLVISHADIDHFGGTLDVADHISIGRVLVSPHLLAQSIERADSSTAYLIQSLHERGIPIQVVSQGWQEQHGQTQLAFIWPPSTFSPDTENDSSLVLSIRSPGGRMLLCGDIQEQAMQHLLAANIDLTADVVELPHHGSYVPSSELFLQRVSPRIALQSSGPGRLFRDKWAHFFAQSDIERLITTSSGMVEVQFYADRPLTWHAFRNERQQ